MGATVGTRRSVLYKTLYPAEIVVSDTFTDADATLLINHTPDLCPVGSVWVAHNAAYNYTITGNALFGNLSSAYHAHVIDSKMADVQINAVLSSYYSSNSTYVRQSGIAFRFINNTFWKVLANYNLSQIQLYDPFNVLVTTTNWVNKKWQTPFNAEVTLSGSSIIAVVDGCELRANSTDNLTATSHGLNVYNQAAYADNFVIRAMR